MKLYKPNGLQKFILEPHSDQELLTDTKVDKPICSGSTPNACRRASTSCRLTNHETPYADLLKFIQESIPSQYFAALTIRFGAHMSNSTGTFPVNPFHRNTATLILPALVIDRTSGTKRLEPHNDHEYQPAAAI